MSATDHLTAAERLLERDHPSEPTAAELVARAQVHATLALAYLELDRQLAADTEAFLTNANQPDQEEAVQ